MQDTTARVSGTPALLGDQIVYPHYPGVSFGLRVEGCLGLGLEGFGLSV
jgi:hypothetical protein